MSQEVTAATDVSRSAESETRMEAAESEADALAPDTPAEGVDAGPGASEGGFAVRFGSGFAAGMLLGGLVGVALNSLALSMFAGFILGTLVGVVLAARG
jgi:predicted lipid-binding transport protein (Tim44 family)